MRAERHTLTSAEWTSCSACHELLCSRAFLFIVLRSAHHPQIPRFLQIFRGIWPMPLSLLNHSALALFAQRTRIPTSARSIGFCAIWVCISSSSSSSRSSSLNKRNRTMSSANHFLTNGTELKVPLQKVSEPTRNRRESSLILRFPKSSRNCTNERPALDQEPA